MFHVQQSPLRDHPLTVAMPAAARDRALAAARELSASSAPARGRAAVGDLGSGPRGAWLHRLRDRSLGVGGWMDGSSSGAVLARKDRSGLAKPQPRSEPPREAGQRGEPRGLLRAQRRSARSQGDHRRRMDINPSCRPSQAKCPRPSNLPAHRSQRALTRLASGRSTSHAPAARRFGTLWRPSAARVRECFTCNTRRGRRPSGALLSARSDGPDLLESLRPGASRLSAARAGLPLRRYGGCASLARRRARLHGSP